MRPPGVYPAYEAPRTRSLEIADTRVAGFVGIAQKGPLDEPRLLRGWSEFLETYGQLSEGYLSRAVEGFFLNGGKSCYVVRVAHRAKRGAQPGPEHASLAEMIAKDAWEKPTLRVTALNEGKWGNAIWARFEQGTAARTLLTLDLDVGAGEAQVASTRGIERGALLRIYDREHSDFVVVTEVGERMLKWAVATPINHKYRAAGPTHLEVLELTLYASLKDRREVFRGLQLSPLSRRYAPRIVNDESTLVRLEDLESKAPLPHSLPRPQPAERLVGGRDGIDALTAGDLVGFDLGPDARAGLQALGGVEAVATVCVPDAMLAHKRTPGPQADVEVAAVQRAMVDLCERLQDRFAVLDAPPVRRLEELRAWRKQFNSSYAAVYYPWIALEGSSATEFVPPSGHIAGVFARCDDQVGVHKAPANEILRGASALMMNLNEDHLGILNDDGVDTIRAFPGRGIRIWGARTTADDPNWRYINVRRLFIMLRRAIESGTQWAVFEPNHPTTWERLSREVSEFLKGLWGQGYFAGGAPEESFYARCNGETNPPEALAQGQMTMEIGVAPAIPTEYIIFSVVQKIGEHATAQGTQAE